jgi:hypothetical protein
VPVRDHLPLWLAAAHSEEFNASMANAASVNSMLHDQMTATWLDVSQLRNLYCVFFG